MARALREQGHDARLIPAQFVKPFLKSNQNDFLDAEAIAEAVERENMRFVPIKTEEQLDLQASIAYAATRPRKSLVQGKRKRTYLTATGLLMEGHIANCDFAPFVW